MVPLSKLNPTPFHTVEQRQPARQISAGQRCILDQLRAASMACRVLARTDLYKACALLTVDGENARRTFVETFVRCLSASIHKQVIWFSPGVVELSFDEAWVMRCLACIEADHSGNLDFLLKSRVSAPHRRYIGFLLGRIAERVHHT